MPLRHREVRLLLLGLALAPAGKVWAWGEDGHRIIASVAFRQLGGRPRGIVELGEATFVDACLAPDRRRFLDRTEAPRHYVAFERWVDGRGGPTHLLNAQELGQGTARIVKSGAGLRSIERARKGGAIFSAIADAETALRSALARGERGDIARAAGDLCHYAGDVTQPLHTTVEYRGVGLGSMLCAREGGGSVHERFETGMVGRFRRELRQRVEQLVTDRRQGAAGRVAGQRGRQEGSPGSSLTLALAAATRAYGQIGPLIAADRALVSGHAQCALAMRSASLGHLYDRAGALAVAQLGDAVLLLVAMFEHAGTNLPSRAVP